MPKRTDMDRLQKKCFIVTATTHGLLVGVLLFGSALMPARENENNVKLLTAFDPTKVTDALSSGGDPNVRVPEAAQTPTPKPPQPEQTPEPPKPAPPVTKPPPKPEPQEIKPVEPPKVIHPEKLNDIPKPIEEKPKNRLRPEDLTPIEKPSRNKIKPNLKEVTRKPDDRATAAREAAVAAQQAADAKARARQRREAKLFASAIENLGHNLSTKTLVAMSPGPGGGGEVSANYRDVIASKYYNAWVVPTSLDEDAPNVVAKVTISRNGDVVNARIIKRSGNSAMDRSVQNALETVTFIEPFPEGSHDQERTVTIEFNLQAKRQIG